MTGTHFHALDDKGRVIIPAKLRPSLGEKFWLMRTRRDNVGIYNYETGRDIMRQAEERMADHPDDELIADAVERITGSAELVAAESGWRVPIPDILRFYAQMEKDVVTVGVLNHAEIWDRVKWEESQAQKQEREPDVRRVQAEIMRAAASGHRREPLPAPVAQPAAEQIDVAAQTAANVGELAGTGTTGPVRGAAPASSGDGKRGNRILALSQLGR
jgi:MraZ protein